MRQAVQPPRPPAAPRAARSRVELLRAPLLVGGAGTLALGALNVRDPHASGSWGLCPFLLMTGEPCPGCGGLRAVNDLTRGDVASALSSNAAAVLLLAVAGVAWVVWVVRRSRGQDVAWIRLSRPWLVVVATATLAFAVLRWTPWGAGLQP